jgi:hypothetical protein
MAGKYYLGWYETNSLRSTKECRQFLLFGIPQLTMPGPLRDFSWKHVTLPCPTCGFAHSFKRSEWNENVELTSIGDYSTED